MKLKLRELLKQAALTMPVRKTHITGFGITEGNHEIKNGRIRRVSLRGMLFKAGFKPVNNYRTLKKAYARGGEKAVIETAKAYRGY